jgi:uncharacterized protein (DUF697 family)
MNSQNFSAETLMRFINLILEKGLNGAGPMSSANALAGQYRHDPKYKNAQEQIDALIKWEASKNFGHGFVTGLGGIATLPVTIPAALTAQCLMGSRMSGAIANLHGHSTDDDRVKTFVLLSLIGEKLIGSVLKEAGVKVGNKVAMNLVKSISSAALREINKQVGFRLLTKAGSTGIINIVRFVPVAGGLVSGAIEATTCMATGKTANAIFGPGMTLDATN